MRRRVHIRAAQIAVLAWAAGVSGLAADEKTPPTTPATDEGITAAKREFDSVKAARDPALQQKNDVPRLRLPEMHTESGAGGTPSLPSSKSILPEKKSANWLLDAMQKPDPRTDRSNSRSDRSEKPDANRERVDKDGATPSEREKNEATREVESERKRQSLPPDPMAQFLAGWMTPQDYALLKPGLDQSLKEATAAGAVTPVTAPVAGLDPATLETTAPSGAKVATPKENPYLTALNLTPPPVGPGAAPAPVMTQPVPAPSSAIAPLPPPVVTPRSKIPEFAKPAQDEKYYKQLKRF